MTRRYLCHLSHKQTDDHTMLTIIPTVPGYFPTFWCITIPLTGPKLAHCCHLSLSRIYSVSSISIWRILCQHQVSRTFISNHMPKNSVEYIYLAMPWIPASDAKVLVWYISFWTLLDLTTFVDPSYLSAMVLGRPVVNYECLEAKPYKVVTSVIYVAYVDFLP